MNKNLDEFQNVSKLFKNNGFDLFMVGGTVRDFLLGEEVFDMDVVTSATPEEMKLFLEDADFSFSKFGSVKYKSNGVKFDITTLRKENNYKDSRHPMEVEFVKDLKIDVKRRDFTINGMYMDEHFRVIDYVGGEKDLNAHVIRMIGNPTKRLKEDPLRIVRAIRFSLTLDFDIDEKLEKAMLKEKNLLKLLRKEKINQDLNKIKTSKEEKKKELFDKFGITEVLNVIE